MQQSENCSIEADWRFTLKHLLRIAFLTFALTTSVSASADVAVRYQFGNGERMLNIEMTVEVDEAGNARIQMGPTPQYALILGDETYLVIRGPDGPYVARMDDLAVVMSSAMSEVVRNRPPDPEPIQLRFVRIGEEQVGGRTGVAFAMAPADEATPTHSSLVVSHDPQLAPVGDVYLRSFRASGRAFGSMFAGRAPDMGGSMQELEQVLRQGAPIKMFGMVLTDVSGADIDPTRFALPSPPLPVEELRAMYQPFAGPPTLPPPTQGSEGP